MTIEAGSVRYTNALGQITIAEPGSDEFSSVQMVAQDRFDKVTRSWVSTGVNIPTQINHSSGYRCYLNGVIVGWFEQADRARGWVDVWAIKDEHAKIGNTTSYNLISHRLFGNVTFEKITVTL